MKEATRKQIEAMKAQTIGVEIEMYGITRQKAAKAAADFFGSGRVEYTAARNGYKTWSTYDTQGREWKFQRDASIRARTDEEKCEMVTPILTYNDIESLQELVRVLRRKGAKSDPDHMCGVHIHIGAAGHDARSLRNLANLMASHEGLLTSAIRIDQSRIWRYCRTVNRDRRHLVHEEQRELRTRSALQRQPLPHAQPPRNLHKGNHRVQTFPICESGRKQEKRPPRGRAQELHSALPGP